MKELLVIFKNRDYYWGTFKRIFWIFFLLFFFLFSLDNYLRNHLILIPILTFIISSGLSFFATVITLGFITNQTEKKQTVVAKSDRIIIDGDTIFYDDIISLEEYHDMGIFRKDNVGFIGPYLQVVARLGQHKIYRSTANYEDIKDVLIFNAKLKPDEMVHPKPTLFESWLSWYSLYLAERWVR